MKKVVLSLLLAFSSLFSVEFHSYKQALQLQKQEGKTIMLMVVRTDCHYCTDMQRDVLQTQEMSEYLEKKYISVKINLDNQELPLGIKTYFTPTFFFIDSEQKIVKTVPGSWNSADFKDLTKNIH